MGLIGILLNGNGFTQSNMLNIISYLFSVAIVLLLVMPLHEYAHGLVATKLGDPTPRWQGRLTLNPKAHLDYLGIISMIFVGFGAARPVSVDSRYFNHPKRDMALVAFAGPLSNIIFGFLACFLFVSAVYIPELIGWNPTGYVDIVMTIIELILYHIARLNINLAIFNLVPIPPLDGSKILFAFLPDRIYWKLMRYERYFYFALLFLIFFSSSFSSTLGNMIYGVLNLFVKLFVSFYGLFL